MEKLLLMKIKSMSLSHLNTHVLNSILLKKQKNWREGYKVIDWASNDHGQEPDVVFAAAGTEPNLEVLAGISIFTKPSQVSRFALSTLWIFLNFVHQKLTLVVFLMKNLTNSSQQINQSSLVSTAMKT